MIQAVTVYRATGRWDPARLLDSLEEVGPGELTCEHAASSYGQPVLVVDGQAYGPADVLRLSWRLAGLRDEQGNLTPLGLAWERMMMVAQGLDPDKVVGESYVYW